MSGMYREFIISEYRCVYIRILATVWESFIATVRYKPDIHVDLRMRYERRIRGF